MQNENYQKLAEEWFKKADNDLGTAKLLLKEESFPASFFFNAPQPAEKYLKGFLVYHGNNIEDEFKIHNLLKLFDYCEETDKNIVTSLKEYCFTLNRYYIETRYPSDVPEYPWQEVEKAVDAAEDLKKGIFKIIKR